ncbi:MAG: hypothetical protein GY739_16515 [Mesoflavibacter sp.]|nr:hypothetical protein [Mesoflavibacter sp.]
MVKKVGFKVFQQTLIEGLVFRALPRNKELYNSLSPTIIVFTSICLGHTITAAVVNLICKNLREKLHGTPNIFDQLIIYESLTLG